MRSSTVHACQYFQSKLLDAGSSEKGSPMPSEYADSIYYSAAETAKIIRAELKAAFPYVKFSVRAENFAQGNAVRVHWENGPTENAVRALTSDKYQSCLPDHGVRSIPLPGGKRAYYAKIITTSRRFSQEITDNEVNEQMRRYGLTHPTQSVPDGWMNAYKISASIS
jgi:hypothetical protein